MHIGNTGIELPSDLVVRIYNDAADQDLKNEIIKSLTEQAKTNPRAHIVRGFYFDSIGNLNFSEELYDHAVYSGKTGTYSKSVEEHAKKLMKSIDMLKAMQDKKHEYSRIVQELGIERTIAISETFDQEELKAASSIKKILENGTPKDILKNLESLDSD